MLQSSSSEKKLVKPLKNCFFRPNLHRKEVIMDHAQNVKKIFFGRNNKSRSSALIKLLFYQNIICFDWVMNLFLSSVMFSVKKVSFPAKTAVTCPNHLNRLIAASNLISDWFLTMSHYFSCGWIISPVESS